MRNKIILLVTLIIIVIGVWLYLFFTSPQHTEETIPEEKAAAPVIPLPEPWDFRAEGYVIIGTEDSDYHIVTGELEQEQAEQLAEKIINDIIPENSEIQEINLFFYSELANPGIDEPDVAEIIWTPEGTNVKIIE